MGQAYAHPQGSYPKPGIVTAIAVMSLVSGILNILWGLGVTLLVVIGTIGIGLLCAPVTVLPVVLGIFEIIYGAQLMADPPKRTQPSHVIAILEICCIIYLNVGSLVVGILALVFYQQSDVRNYFARINAPQV